MDEPNAGRKPDANNLGLGPRVEADLVGFRHEPVSTQLSPVPSDSGIDISLLEESLKKTVWERMLANDDALHFAEILQAAMLNSRAKS